MTIPMPIRQDIRKYEMEGLSRSAIARRLGVSRSTVAKYADMEDFSPKPETRPTQSRSRVEPHARVVDSWLRADRSMPRKQRHTARRIVQGDDEPHGPDLTRYDRFMKAATA